ncbi:MAG: GNAT family N-acetyltransferase [Chloroflexia bacterium]|nr:GNAT family N-acetyltransferase [Chloroflexia bacterium]
MIVRQATPADLPACQAVEASYQTHKVWQMRLQRESLLGQDEEGLLISFRPVRLPRPIVLTPPGLRERLPADWQRRALTLLLEEGQVVYGYMSLDVLGGRRLGWLDTLVIAPEKRRQAWGSRLLQEAIDWGRSHALRALVLETQARNAPAIALAQQAGFSFSGYHEQYYEEAEIALFFTFPLEY